MYRYRLISFLVVLSLVFLPVLAESSNSIFTKTNPSGEKVRVVKIEAESHFLAGYLRAKTYGEEIKNSVETIFSFFFEDNIVEYNAVLDIIARYYIPPEYEEEMRGMAYGLRHSLSSQILNGLNRPINYSDILVINMMAEIYRQHSFSAGAKGNLTLQGKSVVARSLDLVFPEELRGKGIIEYLQIGDIRIVNMIPIPGLIGVVSGLNPDTKVFFEINGGNGERGIIDDKTPPIPWLILGRLLLDQSQSAEDAADIVQQYVVSDPFNPMVADENSFLALSGNAFGWYPRPPVWDMPIEVFDAIGNKVGEDYIINVNIVLTKEGFYYDLAWLSMPDIEALRTLYTSTQKVGATEAATGKIDAYKLFGILLEGRKAVDGGGTGGYHAISVDLGEEFFLFSQEQEINGKVSGAWELNPIELPFWF